MNRCPACGHENQAGAKFCSECAAPMVEAAIAPREERKVVTVLFADLVGFTSRSERLDPEDVRALLSPYYTRLRTELERFGGTVEKFIGDAVMALFGAPVAHEDDPERAVRAALAIRDWVLDEQGDLQVRIAVNTGEALVALTARPSQGEGMASGDVVNTTTRLQTAAPVNGILVGEATYRGTSQVITYREVEPVTAKGKAELVPAWEALEARARFGVDIASASRSRLVGRGHELRALTDALARIRRERSPQLVTLVGVPGIGKSRLVAELFRAIDEDPTELIYWRQGRSLPYGDGVTFWALAEMVKAQAGILETDAPEGAAEKLKASVAALVPDPPDARWIEGHLRPLAGLSMGAEPTIDRREEAFTAWRRFFEALAEKSPLVLVFEDLHWADENLLDFVEHLVGWSGGVPLLVVCTTRPELFERRPGWAGATRNAITLSLTPLSDDETSQLINSLSERPVMSAETEQMLLARAGGNPLYAEQYVRMVAELGDTRELALPETVQGIIAARLDALSVDEKRLLQDAAVLGKVFWLGAIGGGLDRRATEVRLHSLERKDFIQRARRSSMSNEAEFAFLHVLVRDVAYGQIPRTERAEKHRLAAEWIASQGRAEDHAEMLAYHYLSALELRRATGQVIDAPFAERALETLRAAGERAYALNAYAAAASFYGSALELATPGSPEHARLLFDLGTARYATSELDPEVLAASCSELMAVGDLETAAEAEAKLARLYWNRGDGEQSATHLDRARELVGTSEPSRAKAVVLGVISRHLAISGKAEDAISLGREAQGMAQELGLDVVLSGALVTIGLAKVDGGDPTGVEEMERGLAIAVEMNSPWEICMAQHNIWGALYNLGQLEQSSAIGETVAESALRFGLLRLNQSIRGMQGYDAFDLGRWDQALLLVDEFLAAVESGSPQYYACAAYCVRARIRAARDDDTGARVDAGHALELARATRDPQALLPTLATCAHLFCEAGETSQASALVDEFLAHPKTSLGVSSAAASFPELAWALTALNRGAELTDSIPNCDVPWTQAAQAFVGGDLQRAADIFREMGAATHEARCRLWLAQALIKQNRRPEADIELQRAMAFYRSVRATRYIREAERLLAASA